jgi:hypothetical protein
MSLRIWDKVNTPAGEGILTSVNTPGNGLYIDYDSAKCSVYYEPRVEYEGGVWIVKEWPYKDILSLNKNKLREEKLNDLGI